MSITPGSPDKSARGTIKTWVNSQWKFVPLPGQLSTEINILGILEGLRRNQLGQVPVIAVETEGAASLHTSLARGSLTTLAEISSIATSLGARTVAEAAFNAASAQNVTSFVVSDRDALDACVRFADTHRLLVEPACGAALAGLTIHEQEFAGFSRPLVEICGGIGVSLARIEDWRREIRTK